MNTQFQHFCSSWWCVFFSVEYKTHRGAERVDQHRPNASTAGTIAGRARIRATRCAILFVNGRGCRSTHAPTQPVCIHARGLNQEARWKHTHRRYAYYMRARCVLPGTPEADTRTRSYPVFRYGKAVSEKSCRQSTPSRPSKHWQPTRTAKKRTGWRRAPQRPKH